MRHLGCLSSGDRERKIFAVAVSQYLALQNVSYSLPIPLSFYVQEEWISLAGCAMLVCSLPGREFSCSGYATEYEAEILEVRRSGERDECFDGFRFALDPDATTELLVAKYHEEHLLPSDVKKRIFLLTIARRFGLPFWERMSHVDGLVKEQKTVFPSARMLRYHSGSLTVIGFVYPIFDKESGDRVRVFFSPTFENGRYIQWACPERIDFHPSDLEKLSLDRAVVEGWYADAGRFFGRMLGLVA
jgi:hypothetical protein